MAGEVEERKGRRATVGTCCGYHQRRYAQSDTAVSMNAAVLRESNLVALLAPHTQQIRGTLRGGRLKGAILSKTRVCRVVSEGVRCSLMLISIVRFCTEGRLSEVSIRVCAKTHSRSASFGHIHLKYTSLHVTSLVFGER